MRAVVIGGSGQIGGWLMRVLKERGHEAIGTRNTFDSPGLVHLDPANPQAAFAVLFAHKPDVVFYPAGLTWVDLCEKQPELARAANHDQPLAFARAAKQRDARFVYFSSDYIFDGTAGPYDEHAVPNPQSHYARSKLEAEKSLAMALDGALLIVRTTWVYGPERQGKNFAYQLARTLREGRPFVCPSDQISTPTYGPDIGRAVVELVEQNRAGVVHVAGPEMIDRVAFARRLATAFGLDPSLIAGKTTAELGQGAPRPLKGGLRTPRLDQWLPGVMKPVSDSLSDFQRRLARADDAIHPL